VNKNKAKNFQQKYVSLQDVAYILRISTRKTYELLNKNSFDIFYNDQGFPFLSQDDFKKIAYSDEIPVGRLEAIYYDAEKRKNDHELDFDKNHLKELEDLTKSYEKYIDQLKIIHKKYQKKINVLEDETPVCAAYILYAKIINLLKMANSCISKKFWDTFILLRPIDEAIMLAKYFVLMKHSKTGEKHLHEWFRENKSPSNSVCRRALSNHFESIFPGSKERFHKNISILYGTKSKSIHHSLNSILETYKVDILENKIQPVGFDYGECSYSFKILDAARFFKTSIWTAYQGFFICFHETLPLQKEDKNLILFYNQKIFDNE